MHYCCADSLLSGHFDADAQGADAFMPHLEAIVHMLAVDCEK